MVNRKRNSRQLVDQDTPPRKRLQNQKAAFAAVDQVKEVVEKNLKKVEIHIKEQSSFKDETIVESISSMSNQAKQIYKTAVNEAATMIEKHGDNDVTDYENLTKWALQIVKKGKDKVEKGRDTLENLQKMMEDRVIAATKLTKRKLKSKNPRTV